MSSNQVEELVSRAIVREIPEGEESAGPVPEGYAVAGTFEVPPGVNIEELALKAREERQQKCSEAVNKVLEEHNCQMIVTFQLGGNQLVPANRIVNLPTSVQVVSK